MPTVQIVQNYDEKNKNLLVINDDGSINTDINNIEIRTNNDGEDELAVNMRGHVCPENTTSTPLVADATYSGGWQDTLDFGVVVISINTDQNSATDGLVVQWSADGVNVAQDDKFTILANKGKVFTFGPATRYLRVQYTNGSTIQTSFNLQTILRRVYVKPSSHRIADMIVGDDDAELTKSVLTGQDPTDNFINFKATRNGNFKVSVDEYGDTPSIDAFGRLRVSQPYTIFDSKQLHDKQPLFWDESIGGSATSVHVPADANTIMTVTASAADFVIRQTKQRFNYQPGKGQFIFMTLHSPQVDGIINRIGLFDGTGDDNLDPNNGIYFESNDDVSWNICKNGTITETVLQSNWNVDKLDGAGLSGKTLDLTDTQILVIDYEWLGVGRVRVGFVIDGLIFYVHYFNHANNGFSTVYMSTPNLPLRYSIQTDGTSGGTLDHICSTVMSEGGLEKTGILRSVNSGFSEVDAATAGVTYAVVGIRLKAAYLDITVLPEFFSMINTTADDFFWSLNLNPTIAGTFTYSDVTNSAVQSAIGSVSNTVSNVGLQIDGGYVIAGGSNGTAGRKFVTSLSMGSTIAGVMDQVVLCVTPLTNGANIYGSLTFRELL